MRLAESVPPRLAATALEAPDSVLRIAGVVSAVLGVIIANTAVLAAGLMVDGYETAFEIAHNGFLGYPTGKKIQVPKSWEF